MKIKMKIRFLIFVIILFLTSAARAADLGEITVIKLFDAVEIAASGSSTSSSVNLHQIASSGIFSIQVAVSGDGTCKFEYLMSHNNQDFIEPTSATDIATGVVKTSGPGSDGKNIYSFSPELGQHIKIKVTETGTSETVTVTVYLAIQ